MASSDDKFEKIIELSCFSNGRTYFRVKKKFKDMKAVEFNANMKRFLNQ